MSKHKYSEHIKKVIASDRSEQNKLHIIRRICDEAWKHSNKDFSDWSNCLNYLEKLEMEAL